MLELKRRGDVLRSSGFLRSAPFAAAIAAACAATPALAGHPDRTVPVVVEMFVSQACAACPPAAEYVESLCSSQNTVALSWHIDYWNILANPKHGRWRDPYARTEFADRQRLYNRKIRRRATVFTPQAIINGSESVIGSKREKIEAKIADFDAPPPTQIKVARSERTMTVDVTGGLEETYDAYLVSFKEAGGMAIKGGDNAGMHFADAHVVSGITRLGEVAAAPKSFSAAAPAVGMGCAVLIQEPGQGRIVAARYCPQ